MPNFYDTENLPTVQKMDFGPITAQNTPSPRGGYRPEDFERHRPEMLQRTAQKYTAPNGDFDQQGFEKEALTNMYNAGDMTGVQQFLRAQKENELLRASTRKEQEQAQVHKTQRGEARLKFLAPLAAKGMEIYKTQGPEAATEYHRNAQRIALDMGFMRPDEYEDKFDPKAAQVFIDNYGAAQKSAQPTPEQSLIERALTEKLKRKPTAQEIYAEERRTKKEDAINLANAKSQGGGNKPLPASHLEGLADQKKLITTMQEALSIASEKDKQGNYTLVTGPGAGRAQTVGEKIGGPLKPSEKFISYKQKLASINNIMLKLRSGAAVTDQEYARFLKEMPDENTPEGVREQKLNQAISYAQGLMEEKVLTFSEGGYRVPSHLMGSGNAGAARPARAASQEQAKPLIIRNKKTGERRQSFDGGKTWQKIP